MPCCILRVRRRTVSHRCVSADEFSGSQGGSMLLHSPQTARTKEGNQGIFIFWSRLNTGWEAEVKAKVK